MSVLLFIMCVTGRVRQQQIVQDMRREKEDKSLVCLRRVFDER